MKKINIVRSWLIGSFVLFGITSCTAGFEDANRPGHETSLEELGRDDYAVSSFITELQNFAFPEQENTYQNTEDLIGNYLGRYMTYVKPDFSVKNYTCFNASDDWKIVPCCGCPHTRRGPHVCIGINFTCAVNVAFY